MPPPKPTEVLTPESLGVNLLEKGSHRCDWLRPQWNTMDPKFSPTGARLREDPETREDNHVTIEAEAGVLHL